MKFQSTGNKREYSKCPLRGKTGDLPKNKSHMASGFSKTLVLEENGETPSSLRGEVNFIIEFYTQLMY